VTSASAGVKVQADLESAKLWNLSASDLAEIQRGPAELSLETRFAASFTASFEPSFGVSFAASFSPSFERCSETNFQMSS
jgi:hypothetical protein